MINKKSFGALLFILVGTYINSTHFILISAPGSGKGTFSQYLVKKHNYVQICPGDILRHEISLQTDLGRQIESIVKNGDYISEDIVFSLIKTRFEAAIRENKKCIIDGFPRSSYSMYLLDNFLKEQNLKNNARFLQFAASDSECTKRMVERIACSHCFRTYNLSTAQPMHAGICDHCKAPLAMRCADTQEIAHKRLAYFHEHVEPLLAHANQKSYAVTTINAEQPITTLESLYENLLS